MAASLSSSRRISCAELDSSEYEMEYLIDNALVALFNRAF